MNSSPDNEHVFTFFSWNVNGLRAVQKKGALEDFLVKYSPDFLCLQEIKCRPEQFFYSGSTTNKSSKLVAPTVASISAIDKYDILWNPAVRPGYSGTAIFVKKSLKLNNLFTQTNPIAPVDEGRILTLETEQFFLVNAYVPNAKPDLARLELREKTWDPSFLNYLKNLEKTKPVIVCGDFNVAHAEIDIARPKTNHRSAGFTDAERQGMTNYLKNGFFDTFRFLHPTDIRYTWWSHWGHARENNVGWRIDYFLISENLKNSLKSAEIYESILGSDHCPISITLSFDPESLILRGGKSSGRTPSKIQNSALKNGESS